MPVERGLLAEEQQLPAVDHGSCLNARKKSNKFCMCKNDSWQKSNGSDKRRATSGRKRVKGTLAPRREAMNDEIRATPCASTNRAALSNGGAATRELWGAAAFERVAKTLGAPPYVTTVVHGRRAPTAGDGAIHPRVSASHKALIDSMAMDAPSSTHFYGSETPDGGAESLDEEAMAHDNGPVAFAGEESSMDSGPENASLEALKVEEVPEAPATSASTTHPTLVIAVGATCVRTSPSASAESGNDPIRDTDAGCGVPPLISRR
jgi:hypothetical protein